MGHIRLGRLPKTQPWSGVFQVLESESLDATRLARATAEAAHGEFWAIGQDRAVNYCFWVLVRTATAARTSDFAAELERLGVESSNLSSGVAFVNSIAQAVDRGVRGRGQATPFTQIATLSLREVLSANLVEQSKSLFGTSLQEIESACRRISTQKRFGEVAKTFFANLMNRSIRFITDREISNHVGAAESISSPKEVQRFEKALRRYCDESAKIVEEFAAGWFSKHNWETNNDISEDATAAFTAYALEKIQMELREGA
jgi:hypothetical protein